MRSILRKIQYEEKNGKKKYLLPIKIHEIIYFRALLEVFGLDSWDLRMMRVVENGQLIVNRIRWMMMMIK